MSTTLTAARVALLRRLRFAGGRLLGKCLSNAERTTATRMGMRAGESLVRWRIPLGGVHDKNLDSWTLTLERAGRAALHDAEAGDGGR